MKKKYIIDHKAQRKRSMGLMNQAELKLFYYIQTRQKFLEVKELELLKK
jgi:hypothetical protein